MSEKIVIRTRHGEMTLDRLAEIQPGMARLMEELARRYSYLYYAAKGGNWELAAFELRQVRAILQVARISRPKFADDLSLFDAEYLKPIADALDQRNWSKFEEAYMHGIQGSDSFHDKYGYKYIRFTVPATPPSHLHLGPPEKFSRKTA